MLNAKCVTLSAVEMLIFKIEKYQESRRFVLALFFAYARLRIAKIEDTWYDFNLA